MNRCPITYHECGNRKYSKEGLRLLSAHLTKEPDFPYSAAEQLSLAASYSTKLSIAGVQPKLSVRLNVPEHKFEVVERGGTYIVKPPHPFYVEIPENEDLTMRLAKFSGIDVPFHCLIWGPDGSLSYFIKRFDRYGHGKTHGLEDFAQLSKHKRDTKYESSMEKLVPIIEEHCSFPVLDKVKLFRITLFCFLVGNEDMHLKNFSLISRADKVELSPSYDLINTTIVINGDEEFALPINGKRSKITREILCDYYGRERLGLNEKVIEKEVDELLQATKGWADLIHNSLLSVGMQKKYISLINERICRLFGYIQ